LVLSSLDDFPLISETTSVGSSCYLVSNFF
jgi:hypothetical protein